jgi:hypothetical protein
MAQTVDEDTRVYMAARGFVPTTALQLYRLGTPGTSKTITYSGGQWSAHVVNWAGPNDLVCIGPDPITCFITAELMNWSNPDA